MKSKEFVELVKSGSISAVENTRKVIEETKKINLHYNYFNVISEELALEQAKEIEQKIKKDQEHAKKMRLLGLPVSIKDCICVKGIESRAGSKILEGYRPVFDATVVEKLKKEGAIIIGKTAQDEFGFGSFSVNVGVGMKIPLNPFDKERSCGGSSGGSAGITKKADFAHISISESTGGSIVCPASFCGVVGLCPTYGRVSRYGLMDYANSLDKIGPMGKNTEDVALAMNIIAGHDSKDSTSLASPVEDFTKLLNKEIDGFKIGIIKETMQVDKKIEKQISAKIKQLESKGAMIEEISLPFTSKYCVSDYYLIAMTEASTNLAKYCGMRYGKHEKLEGSFNEYFSKVRAKNLGQEAKRRIILGTFARMAGYRDAYYLRAMKVRTKLIDEYKTAFKKFDVLLSPTMPVVAPRFDEIEKLTPLQNYMMDIMTAGPNLAGLPHISLTAGHAGELPVGIMFIADHLREDNLIKIASEVEKSK